MNIKPILLIIITVICTIIIMQNNDAVSVKILWTETSLSKLVLFGSFFLIGLIVGIVLAWPKKKPEEKSTSLSESDQDFIS